MSIAVSVVMPAYNAEKYIDESIVSVIKQTFTDWELIVVDDGSTDTTAKIIKKYADADSRIRYIYQQNKRLGAARNTAIQAAKGEWIAFLDSDDLWLPQKLEKQLEAAKSFETDVTFTNGYILYEENGQSEEYNSMYGAFTGREIYRFLFWGNFIPVLSVLLKKSVADKIGFQDESPYVYGCEDWDYWMRISKSGATFFGMDDRLFTYRIHKGAMSQNLINMKMAECYLLYKNLDFSFFNKQEQAQIRQRFSGLAKQIIPWLFLTQNKERLSYYLHIFSSVSNNYKYILAEFLFKTFGLKSNGMVSYLLK